MTVLNDKEITHRAIRGMINPFTAEPTSQVNGKGVISYGLSSYGYDCRLGHKFKVFTNIRSRMIDPKNFDEGVFEAIEARPGVDEWVSIPPNSFALGVSLEEFKIPRDIIAICLGKSTYARCGIIVSITPLEPEWNGYITIEISNTTPLPAVVYPGEGICQLIFMKNPPDEVCQLSYADKKGKYQDQRNEVVLPTVRVIR